MNWNCTRGQLRAYGAPPCSEITVIGGGVAGLTAAITSAESGAAVRLFEAHDELGGRARSTDGSVQGEPRPARDLRGGALWDWLTQRGLMPPVARPLLTGVRFHYEGAVHRTPPLSLIPPGLRLRGRMAPVDQDFRSWVTDHGDARTAGYAVLAGRRLHLPSRPRRAVGRVRVAAQPAAPAHPEAGGAVHRRRVDADGRGARAPRPGARRADRLRRTR